MKQVYLKSFFLSLLMMVIGNVGAFAAEDVTWVATDPGDLVEGDVVVIVDLNDVVAMPNNGGGSSAPKATKVTLNSDQTQITSTVDDNLQWTVKRSGDDYQFYATESTWLYCTSSNNGVRVGDNSNNNFNIVTDPNNNHANYLYNTNQSCYLGVYISSGVAQDWRRYGTINANIKNTITTFYKKVTTVSDASLTGIRLSVDFVTDFYVNDEFTFGATVTAEYNDGTTKDVTNNSGVSFSGYDMSTPGDQTVTVSYTESGETVYASYPITVKVRRLTSIELSGDYPTEFNVGDTFSHEGLVVTAYYDDNSTKDVTGKVTIFPPDMTTPGEKEVSILYAESVGEDGSEENRGYTITVNGVEVTGITLDQESLTLKAGKTAKLTATITPGNATDKTVTWSSSNESVATVGEDGTVTAVAEGDATITATANGGENITATCVVTVAAASVADGYYVKVTEAPTNWNGEYLIVYETGNVAFDGSRTTLDAASNTIDVEFEDGKIPAYPEVKAAQFTIAKIEGGTTYSIKSASGNYIGVISNSNGLKQSDETAYAHNLSISNGDAVLEAAFEGSIMSLRYNSDSGQTRFRYYKSSGQKAIQLYKKEVTTTNEYTLVAGEEEYAFDGLELTQELPAQTKFYVKDSNGNEYHSADAQSEVIVIAENHENLETSAEGKDFYLKKANTWVFSLTEGEEGALTVTVSPQTEGETTYMLSGYLQESEDVFDENLKLTKEMTSTTEEFYFTRSDDYGLTNLTPASFNAPEDRRYWIFSEDAPTVDFIAGEIRGSYTVGETGLYTFSLDLTNKQVTATKIAKQYALVVGETEYPFDELTLTQELPDQTKFYVKDSDGNEYHSADAQSELIIIAENHENLETTAEGKDFYLKKANTWVFTLTEGDEGAVTLTVSPETAGETKYMLTSGYLQSSNDVFDANNQLTKEMTTEAFYITRSDDYGLTNLTPANFNAPEDRRYWIFSEDDPTVDFIAGEIRGTYEVAEEGLYTITLDLENKTVSAEVATEVTATGNLNNSITGVFAGIDGFTSGKHSISGTLKTGVGNVKVDYAGTNTSYLNNTQIRMYTSGTTLKFTAPDGYDLTEIKFTKTGNGELSTMSADEGEYTDGTWTGRASDVTFTGSATLYLTAAEVTLEKAEPKSPLAGLRVEGFPKDEFMVGDAFVFDATVIAVYEDETEKDVTEEAEFSGYRMDVAGEYQVTVSYTEGELTETTQYDITVREPETVTFRKISSTDGLEAGKRYVIVNEENQKAIAEYYNQYFKVGDATFSDERVTLVEGKANFLTLGGEENAWTFATSIESGMYLALTSDANYLQLDDDATDTAAQWTISFDEDGNAVIQSNNKTERYIRYNSGSNPKRFACYKSSEANPYGSQQPVQLYVEVDENDVDLTISSVGYATLYYSDRALKVPAGVTAKTYKVVDGKLTESKAYEAGSVIPQGEAVVLKGAAGDYTFFASSTTETPDADNQLKGTDEAEETTGGTYYYALQAKAKDGSGGPGMYWMNSTGAAFTNGAHKAYMALDEMFAEVQGLAKSFYLFDDTTGIGSVVAEGIERGDAYNLNGLRVGSGYKGVVIVNGKKFMVK